MIEEFRKIKRDEKTLSFEERIGLKQQSGFDHFNSKLKLDDRREAQKKHQTTKGKVRDKKAPRERYSKLPVSTLPRELHREKSASGYVRGGWTAQKDFARDPRFENSSGHLNQGLFAKSYGFIKEYQNDRYELLKGDLTKAKKIGD